jgi:predicted DNA binding CopG/RHH family protein
MNQEPEFPFDRARRITPEESQRFRAAISEQFGLDLKKRGRPSKEEEEEEEEEDKYEPISIRLHPKILVWAKEEAEKQGIGYQTVINELLLAQIGQS